MPCSVVGGLYLLRQRSEAPAPSPMHYVLHSRLVLFRRTMQVQMRWRMRRLPTTHLTTALRATATATTGVRATMTSCDAMDVHQFKWSRR